MRLKRAKQYRKLMKAYEVSFNFREPYQVLLDAQFVLDAQKFKMHLGQMLENTLSGTVKPMITQCCIRALYNLKPSDQLEQREKDRCIEVAKTAERRRCGHHELEEPLSPLDCLKEVIDPKGSGVNKHRYVVATQNQDVRRALREIAGVPLIYINRSVMILEPMAGKSEEIREQDEKGKIRAGLKSRKSAQINLKRKRDDDESREADAIAGAKSGSVEVQGKKKKKVKGPKEPNPLSVLRSKKNKQPIGQQNGEHAVPREAEHDNSGANGASAGSSTDGHKKRKRKRMPKTDDTAADVDS